MERTFIAIKPDAVQRGLIGEVIKRFETRGFKIVGLKMINVTKAQAESHYAEHVGKPFYERLVRYITSGPVVVMVIEGLNVVASARQMMGATDPGKAQPGTIRADFAQIMDYNIVHGADGIESAKREAAIYFMSEELCTNWKTMNEIIAEAEAKSV